MPDNRNLNIARLGKDYESITVSSTAVALTAAQADIANQAFITVETANIRFRYDGTDPTASEGHLIGDGDSITVNATTNLSRIRFIRSTGTDATIRVTYSN